ncbi:hypothetical protein P3W85_19490 [Cupriavidus basilensis]|uniref:Lipoprotein n=1 Tax=Cupriavidus basilensis TaxID=68895 RepID=A0ABT6ARB2_9BURK|nr:hypothetical protein [Cupriavidus basilensis]MDF3835127.1 hypothetical protein [Cupriavidus basilensis]
MKTNLNPSRCCAAIGLCAMASLVLSACVSTSPVWDKQAGQAMRAASRAQIINPDAPAGLPPMGGGSGKAAVAAMGNYDRAMSRPAAASGNGATGVDFGSAGYGGAPMLGGSTR